MKNPYLESKTRWFLPGRTPGLRWFYHSRAQARVDGFVDWRSFYGTSSKYVRWQDYLNWYHVKAKTRRWFWRNYFRIFKP